MDEEVVNLGIIIVTVVVVVVLVVWVLAAAPCEVFGTTQAKDLPARCLDYFTNGGR